MCSFFFLTTSYSHGECKTSNLDQGKWARITAYYVGKYQYGDMVDTIVVKLNWFSFKIFQFNVNSLLLLLFDLTNYEFVMKTVAWIEMKIES